MTTPDDLRLALQALPLQYVHARCLLVPGTSEPSEVRSNQVNAPLPLNAEAESWMAEISQIVGESADVFRAWRDLEAPARRRQLIQVQQDCRLLDRVHVEFATIFKPESRDVVRMHELMQRRLGLGTPKMRSRTVRCPVCAGTLWQAEGSASVVCSGCARVISDQAYRTLVLATMEATG
jgi:hypothetical protein